MCVVYAVQRRKFSFLGMQIQIPTSDGLNAVTQLTQTDNLHQKLLYISCMSAAAASAEFRQNVDSTIPVLEQLALDEFQPEEVKLEVALQLTPLGKCRMSLNAVVDYVF